MECQSCSSSTTHRRTNYISIFTSFFSYIFQLILQEYRIFYIQLFSVRCSKCGFNFLYTYHTFDLSNCPNCNGEFCKYCMEEYDPSKHDKQKCYRRYLMLYFVGLLAFMALYLKFIFLCNSHAVTKYSMVTIFLCEYIMFYNEVDSFLSNCISLKNIVQYPHCPTPSLHSTSLDNAKLFSKMLALVYTLINKRRFFCSSTLTLMFSECKKYLPV